MIRFAVHRQRVFADTSAYAALVDRTDVDHQDAVKIRARLITERWRVYTTNFVVAETHALLLTRHDRSVAARALRDIEQSAGTTVVRAEEQDEQRARQIIDLYQDKDFSLTDAISFAVMERLEIGYAFTFDRHFAQYGFALLTP